MARRGPCRVKQTDVKQAILGAEKAGKAVRAVRVAPDGTLEFLFATDGKSGAGDALEEAEQAVTEWFEQRKQHAPK